MNVIEIFGSQLSAEMLVLQINNMLGINTDNIYIGVGYKNYDDSSIKHSCVYYEVIDYYVNRKYYSDTGRWEYPRVSHWDLEYYQSGHIHWIKFTDLQAAI